MLGLNPLILSTGTEIWWGCWMVPVNHRMVYAYWSGFWRSFVRIGESWNRKMLSSCLKYDSDPGLVYTSCGGVLICNTCWLHVIVLIWQTADPVLLKNVLLLQFLLQFVAVWVPEYEEWGDRVDSLFLPHFMLYFMARLMKIIVYYAKLTNSKS